MSNVTPPFADWPADTRYLRFGEFRVDLVEARLLRSGEAVELPARAFDVLVLLVRSPHRLLTRDEIFKAVWKNQIVEDANLTQTIWLLRRALGDEDKRCIRTVAKRGYVFAPDLPVEAEPELRGVAPLSLPGAALPERPAQISTASRRRLPWFAWIAAGAMILVALGMWRWMSAPAAPTSIVIVDTDETGPDAPAGAALLLAREWLTWKLGTLRPFEIAGDGAVPTDDVAGRRVVLLSSQQTKDGLQLVAQVFGGATTAHLDGKGAPHDITGSADALARSIVEAITGEPDRDAPLDIGDEAAAQYVTAIRAGKRNNSRRARLEALQYAVQAAPASGWLRLQLAEALAALGRVRSAAVLTERNRGWTDALPAETREILHARWLSASQHYDEAATAYAALMERRPRSPALRLALAQALIGDRRLRDAAQTLDALDPASLPTEQHIRWLQLHQPYDFYYLSPQTSVATQRKIIELAGDTPRFALDRAKAEAGERMNGLQARDEPAGEADITAFDAIAARVAAAGSPIEAARMRVSAASLLPRDNAERLQARIAEMLVLTRAEDDVDGELHALALGAFAYLRNGDIARGRAMYQEVEKVAKANDNRVGMRDAQKFLGQEALLSGRYDEAQRRLESVRYAAVQVGAALATLYTAQGRYADADEASDAMDAVQATERRPLATGTAPAASYGVDCWRAGTQYARGKLAEAALLYDACAGQTRQRVMLAGRIGTARVDFASGKPEQARGSALAMLPVLPEINDVPLRMQLAAAVAQILADTGEYDAARTALAPVLDFARTNGLAPLEARARATLMQLALARDDAQGALAEHAAAMAVAPDSDWQVRSRLRLLHAVLAGRSGDAAAQHGETDAIAADARTRGDVLVELAAASLAAEPGDRERQLVAQTGARGVLLREFAERR